MPPIPVHIDDPITPKKASGVTPQTADSPIGITGSVPSSTTDQGPSTYPAARPGAAAVPAPTPHVPGPVPAPTKTTAAGHDGPPPPQPGAAPVASGYSPASVTKGPLPPPPKAGDSAQRPAAVTTMPPQLNIPSPIQNYAPTHSTATATAPLPGGPTTLSLGPIQPAERPAGYHQDLYAQEMSSAQRASLGEQERREHGQSVGANLGLPAGGNANETVSNVWNTVKGWANTAGQKLAETEEEVWKKIDSRS